MQSEPSVWAAALEPVLTVCLLSLIGLGLANRDVLGQAETKALAKINYWMYLPGLTFLSVASTGITAAVLPLVVNIVLFSMVFGLVVGKVLVKAAGTSPPLAQILQAAMAFRNIGNMPLVLLPSACKTHYFRAFFEGSTEACTNAGNSYIAINIATISMVQFSIVNYLFANEDKDSNNNTSSDKGGESGWRNWLRRVLPPPAAAALLGAVVSFSPLKALITDSFIANSAGILAKATVGATVPLLGATLYNERRDSQVVLDDGTQDPLQVRFLALLAALQLIVMPWVSCSALLLMVSLFRGALGVDDPMMVFVAMLANATPPAIVLLSLAIMHGVSPRLLSHQLLFLYAASGVILPINTMLFIRCLENFFPH